MHTMSHRKIGELVSIPFTCKSFSTVDIIFPFSTIVTGGMFMAGKANQ